MRAKKKGEGFMKKKVKTIDDFYPTKAHGKIPAFHSYEEEASWWDTHDGITYESFTAEDYALMISKPQNETLVLRIQRDIKEGLKRIAKQKGVTVSTLARIWFAEKLRSAS